MTLSVGDTLPDATLVQKGDNGPEQVHLKDTLKDRKVVIFSVPGAFTPTCSSAHVPSFIRTADQFFAKGVDEIICISVNDMHVMASWGEVTGGIEAGITFLADGDSSFTTAIEMQFDAPAAGMFARSQRFSMLVENGVVKILNTETSAGVCEISGGEVLLEQI